MPKFINSDIYSMVSAVVRKCAQKADRHSFQLSNVLMSGDRQPRLALWLCIIILALGFYVRFDEFTFWHKFPEIFFYDGQPVLTNGDGYYYLRMARDIVEKKYTVVDELKKYPDHAIRPDPPPLISSLVAWISMLTPLSLEWAAALLPALIGPLMIIPLYGLCRLFGGSRVMGIATAAFAVLSIQYVNRTRLGFYDTDCLNVTFILAITYFLMLFAFEAGLRRYLYFLTGLIVSGLFLWHWDQVRHIVIVLCLYPLFVALVFYYRPSLKEGISFGICCLLALFGVLFWQGIANIKTLFNHFINFTQFLTTDKVEYFPGTLSEVREMSIPNLTAIINNSTGNGIILFLAVSGLILLVVKSGKKGLFLGMPVCLAALSFFMGNRFLIYFAPVTALGLGYWIELLWCANNASKLRKWCVLGVILVISWPAYVNTTKVRYLPALMNLWPGIKRVAEVTPADAVIWTTWEVGNPLMYYARRRTVSDAQFPEGGERHIYAYMPLSSENQRFAANFIHYFAHNGLRGIHKVYRACDDNPVYGMNLIRSVLSAGPLKARQVLSDAQITQRLTAQNDMDSADKLLTHFFPQGNAPIYLLLHQDMTLSQGWFHFGTWGEPIQQRQKSYYHPYLLTAQEKDKLLTTAGVLYIDGPGAGVFSFKKGFGQKTLEVSKLFIQTGEDVITAKLNSRSDVSFEMYRPSRFGALMDSRMSATTFNTLFIRHLPDSRYFKLIAENIPHYQIWQVHGDRIAR